MKILMHKTSDKTIALITWNLLVIIVISACYLLDLYSLTCTLHVHVYVVVGYSVLFMSAYQMCHLWLKLPRPCMPVYELRIISTKHSKVLTDSRHIAYVF